MSIHVQAITKSYGAQQALDQVSFEIGNGQVVAFLGPNGAGKSTMMKILTCFIPPTSGKATVCGLDIGTDSLAIRRKVGYLPEHNPLHPEMYVQEYLHFVAGIHGIKNKKDRVAELLTDVGLSREQHKRIGALSKGYRQRVGLAQALIHDPDVLILDEPTSGLDPNQLDDIRALIQRAGKEKTVMLSTHIMQEVEAICDRVIIIDKGILVADDAAKNLRSATTGTTVIAIEFDQKVKPTALRAIPGVERVMHDADNAWLVHAKGDTDIRAALFEFAVAQDLKVLSLSKRAQGMEDVFKQYTGTRK